MEHFLMKSACIVSTSRAMLDSVLSKVGWSVNMTRKVRLLVNLPLLAWKVSWSMDLVGGLS